MKLRILLPILFISVFATAQTISDTTIFAPVFSVNYGLQQPGGDLAERFGLNHSIGVTGGVKTISNWQFELDGTFFFGKNIKEQTLLPYATSRGNIITVEGKPASIELYERGFTGALNVGKIFPIVGPNPNSGIILKVGVGFIRHKIRIENKNNLVAQLSKDNLVYVDRLTFGFLTQQYIGYQHLGSSNLANFTFGLEFKQGFTQGMRDYQVDIEGQYTQKRMDFLYGIRVGWVIPVYRKAPQIIQ